MLDPSVYFGLEGFSSQVQRKNEDWVKECMRAEQEESNEESNGAILTLKFATRVMPRLRNPTVGFIRVIENR